MVERATYYFFPTSPNRQIPRAYSDISPSDKYQVSGIMYHSPSSSLHRSLPLSHNPSHSPPFPPLPHSPFPIFHFTDIQLPHSVLSSPSFPLSTSVLTRLWLRWLMPGAIPRRRRKSAERPSEREVDVSSGECESGGREGRRESMEWHRIQHGGREG